MDPLPPPSSLPPPTEPSGHGFTGPLLVWLLLQATTLLVAVARLPLAADYPQPAELMAAHVMAAVQVIVASLLTPYLLRDVAATIAVTCSVWPFLALAGVLSEAEPVRVLAAAGYVSVWLLALAAWVLALPERARWAAVAAATILSIGLPALCYLRADFTSGGSFDAQWCGRMSPTLAALRHLKAQPGLIDLALPAAAFMVAVVTKQVQRRRGQVIHSS